MSTFEFKYRCLGDNYSVKVNEHSLNEALIKFSKCYSKIEEIYSIKEVVHDASTASGTEITLPINE
jgi:hypothetical protein